NVAGLARGEAIAATLRAGGCDIRWLRAQPLAMGLRNGYRNPDQLGADRWACMVGVLARQPSVHPPLLVASFGTATTLDTIGPDNVFPGGLILPGPAMMRGALAYGTATVPAVDKIVGPGNAYVAAAKRRVFGTVGIDMIAGPSEILVICDGKTPADWIAMDLFSQAEHDELAQSILLCPDAAFLAEVEAAIERLLPGMPRADILRVSLANRGALILVRDLEEACAIANDIAPEHLEISTEQPQRWTALIRHAGAIFMGRYSSEALGDYCAGPNHVLPTSRTARFSSPLGVYDFQKRSSLIQVSREGAQTLGRIAAELALGEGLQAHAASAQYRL
ncbi:histidinol dehydrogenase, partial [Bordetella pertussis]